MANSPRTAAPRSACTAAFNGATHSPTLPAGRALMALADIRDAIDSASLALTALCELLTLANGAQISADHLHVLLSPVQADLEKAACDLNDLPLIELDTEKKITGWDVIEGDAADAQAALAGEILLSIPKNLTYEFFTTCGACGLRLDGEGFTQTLRRFHLPLNSNHASYWNPAHWNSDEERKDHLGRSWFTTMRTYITDDFGTLVALEGGAA